ncbi:hypothetical protein EDD85DRAFT_13821 [Armillaria nabsnona]|nr:hypothetical protein EDD85DRAFT_13821 [Armillaria nabsnona]
MIQWFRFLYLLHLVRKHKPIQRAPSGMIVVLNGFPGTGKHTILKRLRELLPANKSSRLMDNHLLIDPVQALFPDRSDNHHDLCRRIRDVVFPCISKLAQEGHVVLMTVCLAADNDKDAAFFREHLALVRGTDVPLYWVSTFCDQQALLERAQSPECVQSSKTKLTGPDILRGLVNTHRLLEPGELSGGLTNLVVRSLDTDGEADESARHLMEMVGLPSGAVAGRPVACSMR